MQLKFVSQVTTDERNNDAVFFTCSHFFVACEVLRISFLSLLHPLISWHSHWIPSPFLLLSHAKTTRQWQEEIVWKRLVSLLVFQSMYGFQLSVWFVWKTDMRENGLLSFIRNSNSTRLSDHMPLCHSHLLSFTCMCVCLLVWVCLIGRVVHCVWFTIFLQLDAIIIRAVKGSGERSPWKSRCAAHDLSERGESEIFFSFCCSHLIHSQDAALRFPSLRIQGRDWLYNFLLQRFTRSFIF